MGQPFRPLPAGPWPEKGDVVGIFIENRPELLVSVLAVSKIGGICAMLNTSQTNNVLIHSLGLVNPSAIIVGQELVPSFEAVRDEVAIDRQRTFFLADTDTTRDAGTAPRATST